MDGCFIGIDIGTQGVRIGVCDPEGKMLSQHEKKHGTRYPRPGWAEQNPDDWWAGVMEAMELCMGDLSSRTRMCANAICVCATSSTVLPVDDRGDPLADAIMWMDNRASGQADAINSTRHPVLRACGGEVSCEWMIPKLLYIKQTEPELYKKTYKLMEQLDWINYKLTGNFRSSKCNAVCKWNYIESKGGFQEDFFHAVGLSDYGEKLVCDVLKIGEPVGALRPELARRFGLPEGLMVVQGGIDAHMSMFGMDVLTPGKLGIIMGTSFVHLSLSDRPDFTGVWGPYDGPVVEGKWLLEGGQISSASIVNWFIDNFRVEGDNPYDVMMREAMEVSPGADGLVMLDYFQGNRTPYKDERATGAMEGLTLKHTRAHIYRAILEAVACGARNIIANLEEQGYPINSITGCGGVTKDELWLQIISDVTGKPIIVNENRQAGVLGCCVVAASCGRYYEDFFEAARRMVRPDGVIHPARQNREVYDRQFLRYRRLYQKLRGHVKQGPS